MRGDEEEGSGGRREGGWVRGEGWWGEGVWGLVEWSTTYVGRGGTRREERGWMRGRKGCTGSGTLVQVWEMEQIDLILLAYHTKYTTRLGESRDDGFDIGPVDWCFVVLHLG